jgi:hypothetical protein
MNDKLKTTFQASVAILTAFVLAFLCIKAYNVYSEWSLWRKQISKWKESTAEPAVNTVPILTTIFCQHFKEDCLKYANQPNP